MIMSLKQRQIKFKTRIKLNHNIYMHTLLEFCGYIYVVFIYKHSDHTFQIPH